MAKVWNFLRREWSQMSTKWGTVLVMISSVAPQLAQFDVRWSYVGAAAGALLILYRGKTDA